MITIAAEAVELTGILSIPDGAKGIVILADSSGEASSSAHQRALTYAQSFYHAGLAYVLVDMFTSDEQRLDEQTGYFRANTDIIQQRIIGVANWLQEEQAKTSNLAIGYFGTGIYGGAILIAAANRPDIVAALVAAGGTFDAVRDDLPRVEAPTLLIAAAKDEASVKSTRETLDQLLIEKQFEQIEGADSLDDDQALHEVARLGEQWFTRWLVGI